MMTVHGFEVSDQVEIEARAWVQAMQKFRAPEFSKFLGLVNKRAMELAAKKVTKWPRVTPDEIAMRLADRLITKWKREGFIVLKRPLWYLSPG